MGNNLMEGANRRLLLYKGLVLLHAPSRSAVSMMALRSKVLDE
ncbi:hypothetical protein BRADI_1g23455v3 [Brachypodium distachyon]|uniref:Uncharacterized protein n=1 Tax=Brachypodium distachyon TaxID=15368 RepID=A0A0Q3JC66_BRADI|nr:hypothetical protein BRADI_1g23455v3 [Brachypodium distachyon]